MNSNSRELQSFPLSNQHPGLQADLRSAAESGLYGSSSTHHPNSLPLSVQALSHTELLANPIYLDLYTKYVAAKGQVEILQSLLLQQSQSTSRNYAASLIAPQGPSSSTSTAPQLPSQPPSPDLDLPYGSTPIYRTASFDANEAALTSASTTLITDAEMPRSSTSMLIPSRILRKREQYPNVKFWTKREAMADPIAHPNPNVRRPIAKAIIDDADGALVPSSRMAEIQNAVRTACQRTLDLTSSWTKQTPQAMDDYIALVESMADELAYCDESGWKAVVLARTFIDGRTRRGRAQQDGSLSPSASPAPDPPTATTTRAKRKSIKTSTADDVPAKKRTRASVTGQSADNDLLTEPAVLESAAPSSSMPDLHYQHARLHDRREQPDFGLGPAIDPDLRS